MILTIIIAKLVMHINVIVKFKDKWSPLTHLQFSVSIKMLVFLVLAIQAFAPTKDYLWSRIQKRWSTLRLTRIIFIKIFAVQFRFSKYLFSSYRLHPLFFRNFSRHCIHTDSHREVGTRSPMYHNNQNFTATKISSKVFKKYYLILVVSK